MSSGAEVGLGAALRASLASVPFRVWAWPVAALVLCDALLVLTAIDLRGERAVQSIFGAQAIAVLTAAAVLLLARMTNRRPLTVGWAATAAGVAAVAAAPIPVEWNADCNTQFGMTYAATAPYVWLVRPTDTRLVFGGARTLEDCYREPRERAAERRTSS